MVALTATASPFQRRRIMKSLCLKNPHVIADSPDRENIKISAVMVKNNADKEDIFEWLISGFLEQKEQFPRHVIFCNSIKDCSEIYIAFMSNIGKSVLFDMYHSKTPDSVKERIRDNMNDPSGNLRVLIATDAAGIGVNFKNLYSVVHFGPQEKLIH